MYDDLTEEVLTRQAEAIHAAYSRGIWNPKLYKFFPHEYRDSIFDMSSVFFHVSHGDSCDACKYLYAGHHEALYRGTKRLILNDL